MIATLLLPAGLSLACAEADPNPEEHGASLEDASEEETDSGAHSCNGRGEPLEGQHAESGDLALSVLDFEPSPPVVGDNSWLVELRFEEEPLVGAAEGIVVAPRMPDHGHGSPVSVGVSEEADGEYRLSPVNTFMPGYWEVEVRVTSDDVDASVMLRVCVE